MADMTPPENGVGEGGLVGVRIIDSNGYQSNSTDIRVGRNYIFIQRRELLNECHTFTQAFYVMKVGYI